MEGRRWLNADTALGACRQPHEARLLHAERLGHRMGETRTDNAFLLLKPGDFSGGVTNFVLMHPPETTD